MYGQPSMQLSTTEPGFLYPPHLLLIIKIARFSQEFICKERQVIEDLRER